MCIPYNHFNTFEREKLLLLLANGLSIRKIARQLGRAPSSISRELRRNRGADGHYSPFAAQSLYDTRRKRCVCKKKLSDPALLCLVAANLLEYWSPEEISGRIKLETGVSRVSYSTIYRACKYGLIHVPKVCFRRKRRSPTPHDEEKRGKIHNYRHIQERPQSANEATEIGHWEGDTVRGALGKGAAATFVDRKTGYLVAILMRDRKAETLKKAMIKAYSGYGDNLKRTFTVDHGNEFFSYREIEAGLGTKIYFADPYSSWQRGLNENTNGLLRQYYPKKFDFHSITQADLDKVVSALNRRPRKKLGFRTPEECFLSEALHLQ